MPYKDIEDKRRYQNEWHRRNRNKSNESTRKYRAKLRVLINEAKSAGCSRCGETDIACLDFHHVDDTKERDIGNINGSWGRDKILAEIAKCEILCANCHRKHHAKVAQWIRASVF